MRDINKVTDSGNCSQQDLGEAPSSLAPNSMDVFLAMLDKDGTIIAVNNAWKRLATENGAALLVRDGIGANYFKICQQASAELGKEALCIHAGLQELLAGSESSFTLEYSCHTSDQKRWFLLSASSFAGMPGAVVVCHVDVTDSKQTEEILRQREEQYRRLIAVMPDDNGDLPEVVNFFQEVSERQQVQETLRASQQRFQAMFDNSLDPILLVDDNARYIDVNPSACKLLGYSREELVQRHIWDITPDSTQEEGRQMWEAFLDRGEMEGEYNVLCKDNSIRVVEFKAVSHIQPGVHLSVLHDVTERKRLWEENQQQRVLLERIINEAPAAIALLEGPEHRYTVVNDAYRQVARGKGELAGRTVAEVWPEAAEVVVPLLDEVFQSGQSYQSSDLPVPILRNQGPEIAYFTFSFTPLYSATGQAQGVLVVAIEMTERKQAESLLVGQLQVLELLARSAQLTEILEALARIVEQQAPDAVASILLLDEDGRLRHGAAPSLPDAYNRAIDGLVAEAHVGTCAAAAARGEVVITPDIASDPQWQGLSHLPLNVGLKAAWTVPILAHDGKVLGTLGTYFREPRTPRAHERRTVELLSSTAAMAIENKQGEIERSRLVAALNKERARLEQLTDSLEQRVRLQTGQIRRLATELALAEQRERLRIAQVLHDDAQQMLTALQLNLHMIGTEAEAETGEKLRDLEGYINNIIDSLRNLAVELRTPALSSENMEDIFTWLASHMEEQHGLEVNLYVEGQCRVPDEERRELIVRLVRELLFNVVKHAGVDQVQLCLKEQGEQLVVTIEDDGVGFDTARMKKRQRQGKGFGLYGVGERARLFDGSLEIESAPGQGTRATLTIPRTLADIAPLLKD